MCFILDDCKINIIIFDWLAKKREGRKEWKLRKKKREKRVVSIGRKEETLLKYRFIAHKSPSFVFISFLLKHCLYYHLCDNFKKTLEPQNLVTLSSSSF